VGAVAASSGGGGGMRGLRKGQRGKRRWGLPREARARLLPSLLLSQLFRDTYILLPTN